jgi:hypothetical protein
VARQDHRAAPGTHQKGKAMTIAHSSLAWRKSGRCDTASCVEVAPDRDGMVMRDSKDPNGPILRFTRKQWSDFLVAARAGDFD